ncbi:hypothetical protein [Fluviicola sp.]|uniref:hypothetical protein n=1 Tax=Fluviicola sp. TaxID=1917219 RepID=UPI0031CE80D9
MKIILTLLLGVFIQTAFAQNSAANLLFEIDNQYIFADTNGNVAFGKRFDDVYVTDYQNREYIVRFKGKYGVVRHNQAVFPVEYDQITSLNPTYYSYLYILRRGQLNALATTDGVIHTGFDYQRIALYSLDGASENKGLNDNGNFFQLYLPTAKSLLMYVDKSNKSKLLTGEPVDGIKDANGMFVLKKGKQQALFEFDKTTLSLKQIHPYAEQSFNLQYGIYSVWNPQKGITKKYSYDHVLLETFKGPEVYDEAMIGPGEEEEENDPPMEMVMEKKDLDRARKSLQAGYRDNVFQSFKTIETPPSLLGDLLKYTATFEVTGKKGDWLVNAHFRKIWASPKDNQKDTAFHVLANEVFVPEFPTGIILTKTGKLYGAVDSRGNELFAPRFEKIERLRGEDGEDWMLVKEGKESVLYFYEQVSGQIYTVLKGTNKDEIEIHTEYLLVKRPVSKKKYQVKLVKWMPPFKTIKPVVLDFNDFYENIVPGNPFPYFLNTSRNGKKGILTVMGIPVIACQYDSIQLDAYYAPLISRFQGYPDYRVLQPIFSAYLNGKKHIYHPTNNQQSAVMIHSFKESTLNATAKISDDGLFVIDDVGTNLVNIYSINGNLLSREPVSLHPDNRKYASFNQTYWYIRGKNAQGKDVLMGRNGAWFVLPDK